MTTLTSTDIFGNVTDLVADSIALIKKYEPPEGYYVCFSGGKDSIVLLDLFKKAGVKYDVHMNLTSVDPPELLKFIRKYYPECQLHRPKKSMFQIMIEMNNIPTRRLRFCCRILKEQGGIGRVRAIGVRWEESTRRKTWKVYKEIDGESSIFCPILEWASDEIWDYIKSEKLPYPDLYNEGFHRIGCIGCPMGNKQRYKQFERWPQFKKAYYNTFQKVIESRKKKGLPDNGIFLNADYLWKWWMEELPKEDKNQSKLEFEES